MSFEQADDLRYHGRVWHTHDYPLQPYLERMEDLAGGSRWQHAGRKRGASSWAEQTASQPFTGAPSN